MIQQPITNDSYVLGALQDVERSAGSFMQRSIVRGILLGPPICLVACVLLGNLLVLVGPHRAEAFTSSLNVATGAYGFFLGIFLGPVVDAIIKDKKATELALRKAIARLHLPADEVGKVLRHHELHLPKSAGAFARLKKQKAL